MDYQTDELLEEALTNRLTLIKDGSVHDEATFNETVRLYNLKLERDRAFTEEMKIQDARAREIAEREFREKEARAERELKEKELQEAKEKELAEREQKDRQAKAERGDRIVNYILRGVEIGVGVALFFVGLDFEKEGTFTSKTFSEGRARGFNPFKRR